MKNENLEKKGNGDSLEEGPVFDIHKMPKGYKVGRFDLNGNGNGLSQKNGNSKGKSINPSGNNKKIGILIISFGVVIVLFLGYLIFSYIGNPNFSLANIFKFGDKSSQKAQITEPLPAPISPPVTPPVNDIIEEGDIVEEEEDPFYEEEIGGDDIEEIENIVYALIDSDEDGLSDDEEVLLGTDFSGVDSDGDGYDDLTELLNIYNPVGEGRLNKNDNIDIYNNEVFGYSVLYPSAWEKSSLSDDSSVIFSINDNSFIQILVEKNDLGASIRNWYASRFFKTADSSQILEENGWSGIYSEDRLVLYLTNSQDGNVYTILYSAPENQPLIFANIFKMMINSFLMDLSNL